MDKVQFKNGIAISKLYPPYKSKKINRCEHFLVDWNGKSYVCRICNKVLGNIFKKVFKDEICGIK